MPTKQQNETKLRISYDQNIYSTLLPTHEQIERVERKIFF